jgi:hypothetical protein
VWKQEIGIIINAYQCRNCKKNKQMKQKGQKVKDLKPDR